MGRFMAMAAGMLIGCSGGSPPADTVPEVGAGAVVGGPTPRVYPSVRDIPANGLIFRIVWPEKMELGPHGVVVLDAHDQPLDAVRSLRWDEEMRVATVSPEGLTPGRLYTLRIAGFTSHEGVAAAPIAQRFVLRAADEAAPSGAGLQVTGEPTPGGSETLRVVFPEAMRSGSLEALTVLVGGGPFDGSWDLVDEDAVAEFTPAAPWPAGPVHVSIGVGVADLAGNELVDRPMTMLAPVAGL